MSSRSILIAVGAALLLAVGFYFAAWSPLTAQQDALEAETAQLQTQSQQLRNQLTQLQDIRDNELQIRADLSRLRALVPAGTPAQPSFVRAAQLAADASGTTIQSVTFGAPTIVEGAVPDADGLVLAQISVNAIVDGGYFQLVDLFRRFEIEVARAVQVDVLGLAEGADGFPQLSAAMTGRVFALLPVTELEVAPDPAATPGVTPTPTPTPTPTEG